MRGSRRGAARHGVGASGPYSFIMCRQGKCRCRLRRLRSYPNSPPWLDRQLGPRLSWTTLCVHGRVAAVGGGSQSARGGVSTPVWPRCAVLRACAGRASVVVLAGHWLLTWLLLISMKLPSPSRPAQPAAMPGVVLLSGLAPDAVVGAVFEIFAKYSETRFAVWACGAKPPAEEALERAGVGGHTPSPQSPPLDSAYEANKRQSDRPLRVHRCRLSP